MWLNFTSVDAEPVLPWSLDFEGKIAVTMFYGVELPRLTRGEARVYDARFEVYRSQGGISTSIPFTPDTLPQAVTQVLLLVG